MTYPFDNIDINGGDGTGLNLSSVFLSSDLEAARLSGVFAHKKRLWLDKHGDAKIWYSVGKNSHLNTEAALKVVLSVVLLMADHWTKGTDGCIQFIEVPAETCSKPETLDHGVLHINTFEAKCCSTYLGYRYAEEGGDKKCQEMCIDKRGCTHTEMEKLLSKTLGLLSPINRPDRDDYITFHPELLSEDLWPPLSFNAKPKWLSLQKCSSSALNMDVPVPYDYLSTMHPITSEYSESMGDPQGVMVTQDATKQYLLDHRHATCPELSHLDLYQVHKAYGCDKKFAQNCGSTPPKCLNYGYLKKDCTCACSKHFGGPRCERLLDSVSDSCYENTWFLNINGTGLFSTTDVNIHVYEVYPLVIETKTPEVKLMQFLTVTIRLGELGKHVSVALNHTAMPTVISKLQKKLDSMMESINMTECDMHSGGLVLYWGASQFKHLRIWCFSSLLLNEPSATVLRSRVPQTLDLIFRSSLGILTGDAQLSIDSLQMQLEVSSFGVMNHTKRGGSAGGEDQDGSPRTSGHGISASVAEALRAAGAGGIVGAGVMGVLLIATIGGLAAWMWSRDDDDDDGSGSGSSELSDYSSDESEPGEAAARAPSREPLAAAESGRLPEQTAAQEKAADTADPADGNVQPT